MRSLSIYHISTIIPLVAILSLYSFDLMRIQWFVIFIGLYSFLYRPFLDYKRLVGLGMIDVKDWKKFVGLGLIRFKFFNELMFDKKADNQSGVSNGV